MKYLKCYVKSGWDALMRFAHGGFSRGIIRVLQIAHRVYGDVKVDLDLKCLISCQLSSAIWRRNDNDKVN